MGDLVNLRTVRKRRDRAQAADRADENRVLHGTSTRVRSALRAEAETADRRLEAHKLQPDDET